MYRWKAVRRLRVAAALTVRSLRNSAELWRDADSQFQPRVTAARELLARLERRGTNE
jgi:hypothetical protein